MVVCSTLTGALAYDLRDVTFDVVVVDEAAQVCLLICRQSVSMLALSANHQSYPSRTTLRAGCAARTCICLLCLFSCTGT